MYELEIHSSLCPGVGYTACLDAQFPPAIHSDMGYQSPDSSNSSWAELRRDTVLHNEGRSVSLSLNLQNIIFSCISHVVDCSMDVKMYHLQGQM